MIKSPHGIYSTETQHVFIVFQRLIVISSRLLKCILQKEHRGQDKFRRQEKVLSAEKCGMPFGPELTADGRITECRMPAATSASMASGLRNKEGDAGWGIGVRGQ
jgi:hypothetical protein